MPVALHFPLFVFRCSFLHFKLRKRDVSGNLTLLVELGPQIERLSVNGAPRKHDAKCKIELGGNKRRLGTATPAEPVAWQQLPWLHITTFVARALCIEAESPVGVRRACVRGISNFRLEAEEAEAATPEVGQASVGADPVGEQRLYTTSLAHLCKLSKRRCFCVACFTHWLHKTRSRAELL